MKLWRPNCRHNHRVILASRSSVQQSRLHKRVREQVSKYESKRGKLSKALCVLTAFKEVNKRFFLCVIVSQRLYSSGKWWSPPSLLSSPNARLRPPVAAMRSVHPIRVPHRIIRLYWVVPVRRDLLWTDIKAHVYSALCKVKGFDAPFWLLFCKDVLFVVCKIGLLSHFSLFLLHAHLFITNSPVFPPFPLV